MNNESTDSATFVTGHQDLGKRLDRFLAEHCLGISRARLQLLIRNKLVTIDGRPAKSSALLRADQTVVAPIGQLESLKPVATIPEDIPLDVLFQDDDVAVINKPAGMVVHPAKGHWSGTLTAALLHHFGSMSTAGGANRPGIVHRLDRDTSGVIIVARNDFSHTRMAKQFEKRTVKKRYMAIVSPAPDRDRDAINAAIGPHPYSREKMAIRDSGNRSKPAETFYEVTNRHGRFGKVLVFPKTGRTHQIRVHLAHIGCPVMADRLYSGRGRITPGWIQSGMDDGDAIINRQALHAESVTFRHPRSDEELTISAPPPDDIERLWQAIASL